MRETIRVRKLKTLCALTVGVALAPWVAQARDVNSTQIEEIEVIGITPTDSGGLDASKIAANVQSATSAELQEQHNLDLSEFMNRNFAGVYVNQAQNNPLQPDVQFRGFVASPLLGLPQGLSVYQDGVRINESFGDTVNWALIPEPAIATIDLIPGSNPLFGLNTLGGALSVRTKNGHTHPGGRAELSAGSFGRITASVEKGGALGNAGDYFATIAYFEEDGWRDFSPSDAIQIFTKIRVDGAAGSLELGLNIVETDLIGNGPAPVELLAADRTAVFTRPDITENTLSMLNLRGTTELANKIELVGNVYVRNSDISTLNGDDSDFEECQQPVNTGFICEFDDETEELVENQAGLPIAAEDSLIGAAVNRSETTQDGFGGTVQISARSTTARRDNLFIAGASFDSGRIDFRSGTELGALDSSRQAVPGGEFANGAFIDLRAEVDHYGVFLTNTIDFGGPLAITASGRYNKSKVVLSDQLGTALNGSHEFDRLNPALGLTYRHSEHLNYYVGYSESNRIPTPVELTCADPEDPCRLPNAFLADPPLEQVVGKSWDIGARGRSTRFDWHIGYFHTTSINDIIFVSAGALTNQGFFSNVGDTVRKGVELGFSAAMPARVTWHVDYTWISATFEENLTLFSLNNPSAVNGEINIQPGDKLPLVPNGMLKAGVQVTVTDTLSFGATLLANTKSYFRGDESNDADPISGHTLINLRGEYRLGEQAVLFAMIDNIFDTDYETFGLFGEADEVLGDGFGDPRFLGPGAPRAAWIGVLLEF